MQSLMPIHFFVFKIRTIENDFADPKRFRDFRETGPRTARPNDACHARKKRKNEICVTNLCQWTIKRLFACSILETSQKVYGGDTLLENVDYCRSWNTRPWVTPFSITFIGIQWAVRFRLIIRYYRVLPFSFEMARFAGSVLVGSMVQGFAGFARHNLDSRSEMGDGKLYMLTCLK